MPQSEPFTLVWTPLPFITMLFPIIGHMGICDSQGRVYDFQGPYLVGKDHMAFGKPIRYLKLDPSKVENGNWNEAVERASLEYEKRIHYICWDNCHSHVALALNQMKYKGGQWNMFHLAFQMFFFGRFVGWRGFIQTFLPTLIFYTLLALLFSFLK